MRPQPAIMQTDPVQFPVDADLKLLVRKTELRMDDFGDLLTNCPQLLGERIHRACAILEHAQHS